MNINRLGILVKYLSMQNIIENKIQIPITMLYCYKGTLIDQKILNKKWIVLTFGFLPKISSTKTYLGQMKKKVLYVFQYIYIYKFPITALETTLDILDINIFKSKNYLNICGKSIGKGFLSNIKKNHFQRGPMSHGSMNHRLQGSLGSGTTPGRVIPGKKMASRKKSVLTTLQNLKIVNLNLDKNLITVHGNVMGKRNSLLFAYFNF